MIIQSKYILLILLILILFIYFTSKSEGFNQLNVNECNALKTMIDLGISDSSQVNIYKNNDCDKIIKKPLMNLDKCEILKSALDGNIADEYQHFLYTDL